MKLRHIDYSELSARQKEVFNFQKVASLLAEYGFNCIKLTDDWLGADFLAYHKDGTQIRALCCSGGLKDGNAGSDL